jgi:hypothetical protein
MYISKLAFTTSHFVICDFVGLTSFGILLKVFIIYFANV